MQLCEHSWRERPAWKRLHHRCRGRPLAASREQRAESSERRDPASSWPPPRGPDDLGRSSARPHQGAAALQILRVNFYDKCLCKVMHIDFHLFYFFPSFLSLFFVRVEGTHVSDSDVSCLLISRGDFFFPPPPSSSFLFLLLLLNDPRFIGEHVFLSLLTPIKSFFQCSL